MRESQKPPMPVKAYIFLLITTLLWAGNAVVGKFAVGHISPLTPSLFRWMLACSQIGVFEC